MSSRIVMSLVLIFGIGIGSIIPAATAWWFDNNHASIALDSVNAETATTSDVLTKVTYHFEVEPGVLSVVEGTRGAGGRVITRLNIQTWSKEMLDMAPKIELYSLDEVQSFIDTVNETLWLEKKGMK